MKVIEVFTVILICLAVVEMVYGHAVASMPLRREPNSGVCNCGTDPKLQGSYRQADLTGSRCGVCGDQVWNGTDFIKFYPQDFLEHEYGGPFWTEPIEAYVVGQIIIVQVTFSNVHEGGAEWRICDNTKEYERFNQSCFNEHLLEVIESSDARFVPIQSNDDSPLLTRLNVTIGHSDELPTPFIKLRLPSKLYCEHCTLQFTYSGRYKDMFRSCHDIRIYPYVRLLQNKAIDSKCLAQKPQDMAANTLELADCNAEDLSQSIMSVFSLEDLEYRPIVFGSNNLRCLALDEWIDWDTAKVGHKDCEYKNKTRAGNALQSWSSINKDENSWFQLKNRYSEKCLTGNYTAARVTQMKCDRSISNQVWRVITIPKLHVDGLPSRQVFGDLAIWG